MKHIKILRAVEFMLNHYRDHALLIAMYRINLAQHRGNDAALARWQKIADAIEQQLMSHSLFESSVH